MDQDSKNIAIASYITPVGLALAFAIKYVCNCRTPYAIFHLRQGLGLNAIVVIGLTLFSLIDISWLTNLFRLFVVVAIIYGLFNTSDGKQEPLPWLGKWFDARFSFIQ